MERGHFDELPAEKRFRCLCASVKEIEIAPQVRLSDMLHVKSAEASLIPRRLRLPQFAALRQLIFSDQKIQFSASHVELD